MSEAGGCDIRPSPARLYGLSFDMQTSALEDFFFAGRKVLLTWQADEKKAAKTPFVAMTNFGSTKKGKEKSASHTAGPSSGSIYVKPRGSIYRSWSSSLSSFTWVGPPRDFASFLYPRCVYEGLHFNVCII
jgi:hypothetical protein